MITHNLKRITLRYRAFAVTVKGLATLLFVALTSAPSFAQSTNSYQDNWTAGADMATGRSKHTATLLADGSVLVAGGADDQTGSYLSSAERYDPLANTWSPAGALVTARMSHTSTRLINGKVLIVGGVGASGVQAGCELFDPNTSTWSPAATMLNPRFGHTATLLNDGRVLVCGGLNEQSLNSAELYDPGTDTWSPAATMQQARNRHTATLLNSGEVLAVGGFFECTPGFGCALQSVERYNPASDTWTAAMNLPEECASHTATLLGNGKVLIAGGYVNIFARSVATYRLYDPSTDSWTVGSMPSSHSMHYAVALPFGKVLIFGGMDSHSAEVPNADVYEPLTDTWSAGTSMSLTRANGAATRLADGRVLVTGGYPSLATTELYRITMTAPGSPTNVSAGERDSSAAVSWLPPNADGGSPITGYTITASPGGATATAGLSERSVIVNGLANGTTYSFTVTATNAVGTSLPSPRSNPVTPFTTPDPPTGVTATAGNASATVSWIAPASNGGRPIYNYIVVATPGNLVQYIDGSTTSATITGLTNGVPYTFTVWASNPAGNSLPSSPSNSVIPEALAVVSKSPIGTGASVTPMITATFNRPVIPLSLKMLVSAGHNNVDGTISCNSPCTVATFTPKRALKIATTYNVSLSASRTDESVSTSWSFTTALR